MKRYQFFTTALTVNGNHDALSPKLVISATANTIQHMYSKHHVIKPRFAPFFVNITAHAISAFPSRPARFVGLSDTKSSHLKRLPVASSPCQSVMPGSCSTPLHSTVGSRLRQAHTKLSWTHNAAMLVWSGTRNSFGPQHRSRQVRSGQIRSSHFTSIFW